MSILNFSSNMMGLLRLWSEDFLGEKNANANAHPQDNCNQSLLSPHFFSNALKD